MVTTIRSLGLGGIRGYEVTVECMLAGGLPAFDIVGLPDAAVKESRERVRAAVKNCGAKFPVSHVTVNLAPARVRKEGTVYDLPIFLGVMVLAEALKAVPGDAAFLGELSLTGRLRPVSGVLPMALCARRQGIRMVVTMRLHPLSPRLPSQRNFLYHSTVFPGVVAIFSYSE